MGLKSERIRAAITLEWRMAYSRRLLLIAESQWFINQCEFLNQTEKLKVAFASGSKEFRNLKRENKDGTES